MSIGHVTQKINETKSWFFEKINNIHSPEGYLQGCTLVSFQESSLVSRTGANPTLTFCPFPLILVLVSAGC